MDLHEPYLLFNTRVKRKYSRKISRLSQVNLNRAWKRALEDRVSKRTHASVRSIIDIYDDNLRYIDYNLNELFSFLSSKELVDSPLMILSSDHGQEFLDHGRVGHGSGNLYDEILHIPLILFGPGIQNRLNRSLVSQLDIALTILKFFEIIAPKDYRGYDALSSHTNRFILSEGYTRAQAQRIYAVRTEKWKYIGTKKQLAQFYNLEKDPKETKNVIDEEEAEAKEFEAIIEEHIEWEEKLRRQRAIVYEKERIRRKIRKLKPSA